MRDPYATIVPARSTDQLGSSVSSATGGRLVWQFPFAVM
jgi:hypothetical protein